MIDTTDAGISREVEAAELARDARIRVAEDLVKKYHTTYFSAKTSLRGMESPELEDPANLAYQYLQTIVPQIVFTNPKVRVSSRKTGVMEALAAANKQGVNRWVRDVGFSQVLRQAAYDSFFPFGVIAILRTDDPWPKPYRIAQQDFIRDPYALSKQEMRYTGHRWWIGREELLSIAKANPDEGWDEQTIRTLPIDKGIFDLEHRGMNMDGTQPPRKEVVLYDFIVHGEVQEGLDPERFPSTIYTLAQFGDDQSKLKSVREPRPYYGYGENPYTIFDYGYVPNETYGLSPLVANVGQSESLNRVLRGTVKRIMSQKRFLMVDGTDANFASKLANIEDRGVLQVEGFTKEKYQEAEVGGVTNELLQGVEVLKELLDRNLGLTDAQRGATPTDTSATASQLAATAGNIRVEDLEQTFYERASDALKKVAFYIFDDQEVDFPLDRNAIKDLSEIPYFAEQLEEIGPMDEVNYQGGDVHMAPEGTTFDDLELDIEPHSMRRVTEDVGQKRGLEMVQIVTQLAQLKAAMPDAADWDALAGLLGDQMNLPDLNKILSESKGQGPGQGAPQQASLSPPSGNGSVIGQETGAQLGAAVRQ